MYKRISSLATADERAEIEAELADRFGPVPPSVANLLNYAQLKSTAETLMVQSVERKADEVWMRFHEQSPLSPEKLTRFLRRHQGASFRPDGTLRIRITASESLLPAGIENALRELRG